jgi:transcriptional regulator with XRE-family HTH domain
MNERQKRLNEVYEHLRKFYGIHTQSDFANALRKSRNAITLALNGDEKYLTNKLFKNICEAYKGVFNLDYLLTGEGDLLTLEEEVHSEEFEKQAASVKSSAPDSTTEQTYIMSKMLETLLKPIESAHAETVAALNQQITEKQSRIDDLERTVADKDEIIRTRESRILELERRLAQSNADDLSKYPYTIGVAEERTNPQNKNILK